MGQLSSRLRNVQGPALSFWCPGCDEAHVVGIGPNGWTWNGDADKPVFSPSVLVTGTKWLTDDEHARLMQGKHVKPTPTRCHTFVGCNGAQPGEIIFLGDCTHALAGTTVDLPAWPNQPTGN